MEGFQSRLKHEASWLDPEEKAVREDSPTTRFDIARRSLGFLGLFSLIGGTVTVMVIFGFLVFLWTGEGSAGGEQALGLWRSIMLGQRITQTITLSTVVIRIVITAQASILTSLVAAVILERYGVPLSRVAEVSILRSINDGPLRLTWLLLWSSRTIALYTVLISISLFTSIGIQFSSTVLVADLGVSVLVADPLNETLPVHMTTEVISLNHQINNFIGRPTAYLPFGEVPIAGDPTPNDRGVSDTGIVQRAFLPVPPTRRGTLRHYRGKGYGLKSRLVCMQPWANTTITVSGTPRIATIPFYLQIHGNISYAATFAAAGLPLPQNCTDASCFPRSFNCSLPQFQLTTTAVRQGFTTGLCLPDGRNSSPSARNYTLSTTESIPAWAQVFLFFRSNGTYDLWRGPNNTVLQGNFRLVNVSWADGEWVTYERKISGTLDDVRFDTGTLRMDISLCFQQVAFDYSDLELSTTRDLNEPTLPWNAPNKAWDTSAVRRLLGLLSSEESRALANTSSPAERGIFAVDRIANGRHLNNTQYFTNKLINNIYNSPNVQNVSLFMDPQGSGRPHILPHVEYQALFADILNITNRPAVAMQGTMTALAGSVVNEAVPQLDFGDQVTTTSSIQVLAPRSCRGLVAVGSAILVHLMCGALITILFLRNTRYSAQGNYWQAVSQIVSEHTNKILHKSTQAADGLVDEQLKNADPSVRIARSQKTGRIEVSLASSAR